MSRLAEVVSDTLGISGFQIGRDLGDNVGMDVPDQIAGGLIHGTFQVVAPSTYRGIMGYSDRETPARGLKEVISVGLDTATIAGLGALAIKTGQYDLAVELKLLYNAAVAVVPDVASAISSKIR